MTMTEAVPSTIDVEQIKLSHGHKTRQGHCQECRKRFPCQTLEMAREIDALTGALATVTAEHAECSNLSNAEAHRLVEEARQMREARDETLGKLATAYEESSAFRRQRDEAREALAHLTGGMP